jgi:FKBP-type peptidyl-prolyl cis-trans isomerase
MVVGEKRRLWVPPSLAQPRPPGQPIGALVFDVELVKLERAPVAPEVPADLTAPPSDARKTKSGLVYRVLHKGTGTKHPRPSNVVKVHYSGWTTDGTMFDSSVIRGEPASFPLRSVIAGWTEGLQLMVVGEKARFWIPSRLAYGDQPGTGQPAGTLVFDVELIDIR